jgi:hypothetical protein
MTATKHANTDLVAEAWIGSCPGLSTSMVGPQLPKDNTSWAASGFVTYLVTGGTRVGEYAHRRPVLTVSCWAVSPKSSKPPWGLASNLAETIIAATDDEATLRRTLALTVPGYPPARLTEARVISELRRSPADEGDYARLLFDLELNWIELP